jgi:PhnB protein
MSESKVRPTPEGFSTVTPSLTVNDAAAAIDFYRQAFGAVELSRAAAPDGKKIWHADLQIGDSRVMLNDEFPEMGGVSAATAGGSPITLWLYVEDVDAVHKAAVEAGATATFPVETQFWGDRTGGIKDPFGLDWNIATRVENPSEDELKRRRAAFSS